MTNSLVLNILYTIPVDADKCFVRGEQTFGGHKIFVKREPQLFLM